MSENSVKKTPNHTHNHHEQLLEFLLSHRTTEWFGLKGGLKIIQSNALPCAGTPSAGGKSPIPPGPEHFQGWGIHNLSGQGAPVPHHPQGPLSHVLAVAYTTHPLKGRGRKPTDLTALGLTYPREQWPNGPQSQELLGTSTMLVRLEVSCFHQEFLGKPDSFSLTSCVRNKAFN